MAKKNAVTWKVGWQLINLEAPAKKAAAPTGLTLFQIEQEYRELCEELMESEGEASEELSQRLAINQEQLEKKGTGYAYLIKQLDAEAEMIDAEMKRLAAMKSQRTKTAEKLKATLKAAMDLYGVQKIQGPTITMSIAKNPASVQVLDEEQIPAAYLKYERAVKVSEVKTALQAGTEVPGVKLITDKTSLRIK